MKNMKRVLAAVLALLMIASLAACGKKNDDNSKGEDKSLQRVLDAGKLSIGAEGNWIPYVYNDEGTGTLTGFEVEVAQEIAKRLGVTADFNISDSWDPVMAGLDAARYDVVICGVNPKPERQEKYAVSASYAENPFCLVVNGDNEEIKSFDDLKGKLCANSPSSPAGQIAQSYGATTADTDLTGAMDMLNTKRVDGHVNNVAAVDEYMTSRPDVNVKIAAIYEPAADQKYMVESAAMFRKDDQALCDKVSEIINEMIKDKTLYNLTVKYFGQTVADSVSLYK